MKVLLRRPHKRQDEFINSPAKRKIIRAGRRGGKTTGIAIYAVKQFLAGRRVLYATPTQDQIDRFWFEVVRSLAEPIDQGVLYKNETKHIVELSGTEQRIRAKTAWNADTMRGDYADVLIFDEWQLMDEDAWGMVGAPMMLDTNGDAVFIYTPPSIRSKSVTKAKDPRHASKLFKQAAADKSGRWEAFHFSSHENPHLNKEALKDITKDMTRLAYEQEILALDKDDNPRALWTRETIEDTRQVTDLPEWARVVVAIDPSTTSNETSDEAGITVGALGVDKQGYLLEDATLKASPNGWASQAVALYRKYGADRIIGEANNGGDMIESIIRTVDPNASYKKVWASRGKQTRAEPVAALYEQGKVHHVGSFPELEDELCSWEPGMKSPNRLDALVWGITELMLEEGPGVLTTNTNPFYG